MGVGQNIENFTDKLALGLVLVVTLWLTETQCLDILDKGTYAKVGGRSMN